MFFWFEAPFEQRISSVLDEYGIEVLFGGGAAADVGVDAWAQIPVRSGSVELPLQLKQAARYEFGPLEADRLRSEHSQGVLVCQPYINPRQAERYRSLGLFYVDCSGNAWIHLDGFHLQVEGRRAPVAEAPATSVQNFTKSWVRVVFALLQEPSLAAAPVRVVGETADVSTGAAHRAVRQLGDGGYLQGAGTVQAQLRRVPELAEQWAMAYTSRLFSSLVSKSWDGPAPQWWLDRAAELDCTVAGEPVALGLRNPRTTTVFVDAPFVDVVRAARLRTADPRDGDPAVVTRQRFWNEEALRIGPVAPPLLTAAELLASADERLHEVGSDMLANLLRGMA